MSTPLLTAEEVAAMIGMTSDWVYGETRAGRIPHVKLGRYRRYRRETIEQWLIELESATMAPTSKRRGTVVAAPGMAQEASPS
ncbi:MAG: helix-turn-helix domain-containing protein [Thermoleophilaceae bacterium]